MTARNHVWRATASLARKTTSLSRRVLVVTRAGGRRLRGWTSDALEDLERELDANGRFFAILNEDPLSQLARQERRRLLLLSAVAVTVVSTGLLPKNIAALGIEFSATDRQALLYVLAAIVIYYLLAFSLYAATDLLKWLTAMGIVLLKSQDSVAVADKKIEVKEAKAAIVFDVLSWPLAFVRGVFDFLLPVAVAIFAAAAAIAGVVPYNARLLRFLKQATDELVRFINAHQ